MLLLKGTPWFRYNLNHVCFKYYLNGKFWRVTYSSNIFSPDKFTKVLPESLVFQKAMAYKSFSLWSLLHQKSEVLVENVISTHTSLPYLGSLLNMYNICSSDDFTTVAIEEQIRSV